MTLTAELNAQSRWVRTLETADSLADDLDVLGTWVGPRTGPCKRTQGQKEDYLLRRLLVAWKRVGRLRFPVEVTAETVNQGEPDFYLNWHNEDSLGVEVTEAGEENYQAWLTFTEDASDPGGAELVPLEPSTARTVEEIKRAIRNKIDKFDRGSYRNASACDLLVYDNTAWGGFLEKDEIVEELGRPNDLMGRFRETHLVFGELVYLDVFGRREKVDISHEYEIDYAHWIHEQVERLRHGKVEKTDGAHIAEELESLGRSERRALASHVRNLLLHFLKWQFQPNKRSDSWAASIDNARAEIYELLTEMPNLKPALHSLLVIEFRRARRAAARETKLNLESFPEECPYDPRQVVDPEFWPNN